MCEHVAVRIHEGEVFDSASCVECGRTVDVWPASLRRRENPIVAAAVFLSMCAVVFAVLVMLAPA